MGSQWRGMGLSLMRLACFRDSILRADKVLKPFGVQVSELLLSTEEATFDDIVNTFVSLTTIQVCPRGQGRGARWRAEGGRLAGGRAWTAQPRAGVACAPRLPL